jgi:hypothetical protein
LIETFVMAGKGSGRLGDVGRSVIKFLQGTISPSD